VLAATVAISVVVLAQPAGAALSTLKKGCIRAWHHSAEKLLSEKE
jgi:hypothetical protein